MGKAQIPTRAVLHVVDKPHRACRGHDQTKRVRPYDALQFATLIVAQTIEGVGGTNGNFHGPAYAILAQDLLSAQGEIDSAKGFEGWGWFSLTTPCGCGFGIASYDHDSNEAPGQHRMPALMWLYSSGHTETRATATLERGVR